MPAILDHLAALLTSAPLFRRGLVRREQARLEGTWVSAEFEALGRRLSSEEADRRQITLRFRGDRVTMNQRGALEGTYAVDPWGQPRTIDLTLQLSDCLLTLRAVYELEDDALTLHLGGLDGRRPADFTTRPGTPSQLIHFRRQA